MNERICQFSLSHYNLLCSIKIKHLYTSTYSFYGKKIYLQTVRTNVRISFTLKPLSLPYIENEILSFENYASDLH